MNKVLILGAGLVAKPMVEYLLLNRFRLMIASPVKNRADEMIGSNPFGSSTDWSMADTQTLEKLVSEYDITVSLLPFKFHADVARVCLRYKKSLITTSYEQAAVLSLNEPAKKAGVIFLNEMGLDPGIDHMSAMRIINTIHAKGGKVSELYSLCGALPAPESATNPLKYKFTWSPTGVILASLNSARYLKKGKEVLISPDNLFKARFRFTFPGIDDLEVYPNRDSMNYIDIYGIPEVETIYRGTIRFQGWCETLDAMKTLKMLDDTYKDNKSNTYAEFLGARTRSNIKDLKGSITGHLGISDKSVVIEALDWLGFFREEELRKKSATPFDITSDKMITQMLLSDNERDMVLMQHMALASYPDGKKEVVRSYMTDYGTPSANTAIARTVSLPAAITVKMILENKLKLKGVLRPVVPEIYNPVLDELKNMGIEMKEEYGLPEREIISFHSIPEGI